MNSVRIPRASTVETAARHCAFVKRHLWQFALLCWLLLPLAASTQVIEIAAPNEPERGRFGFGVLGIADLTGDGIGELSVATTETVDGLASVGSVYILNGRDFSVIRRLVSPQPTSGPSASFGTSMVDVPDLNGDQVRELVVTSMQEDRAYVFSGISEELLQTLHSPISRAGGWWGAGVVSLGVMRSNAAPSIAISTPGANAEQGDAAEVHVFDPVSGEVLFSISNPGPKRWFGASLANIGDVDGDGRDDLAAGAGAPVPPYYAGTAYVLSGETGKVLHELIAPVPANTAFQWNVAAVPDVNADGKTDVLVGIGGSARPGTPTQSGHVYLFSGADGKLLRSLVSPNPKAHGGFGWSMAGVPDVTGDGAGELLIGAGTNPFLAGFETYGERRMYLINGATGRTIQSFASPYEGESMGWNVAVPAGKGGKLKNLIAGVRREKSLRGRVFVFPLRLLRAGLSAEGIRVSLTTTDENNYELQSTLDLKAWTTLTTLKATMEPITFLDKESNELDHRFYRAEQMNTSP